MAKPNDPGRTWEMTNYTGGVTYTLQHGGWSYYGYLKPVVYRTSSAVSAPSNVQDRKLYEVPESEYDVYPASGEVVFHQAQPAGTYVYVTLGNDYLRTANAQNALCLECHAISTHKGVNCAICHGTHGTGNLYDVRGRLGTPGGYADVTFTSLTAMGGATGVCTVCHTTTMYHNVTSQSPVGHYDNQVCTDCHPHRKGFPSFTTVFNPIKRWFADLFATDSAYAKPPAWVTDGSLPPGLQNHSLPEQFWENGLKKFKVSFEIVRQGASNENNEQSTIKDDIIYYYHNDHLGTPCFLTDETGTIVWRREQTPFGETTLERGSTTEPLRFPGQYFDTETGLAQNWHRDYRVQEGRYNSADKIRSKHSYSYADNNPEINADPLGLCTVLVRFKLVGELVGLSWYHSYTLTIGNTGVTYYRAGPSKSGPNGGSSKQLCNVTGEESKGDKSNSAWGTVIAESGAYTPSTIDYVTGNVPTMTIISDNKDCSFYDIQFNKTVTTVNRSQVPYKPLSYNCNSFTTTMLGQAGLGYGSAIVWAPGWGTTLPLK